MIADDGYHGQSSSLQQSTLYLFLPSIAAERTRCVCCVLLVLWWESPGGGRRGRKKNDGRPPDNDLLYCTVRYHSTRRERKKRTTTVQCITYCTQAYLYPLLLYNSQTKTAKKTFTQQHYYYQICVITKKKFERKVCCSSRLTFFRGTNLSFNLFLYNNSEGLAKRAQHHVCTSNPLQGKALVGIETCYYPLW